MTPRTERSTVPLTGPVVVVADTHSRPHPALAARIQAIRPCLVLHAGDIGDLDVLDALAQHAPVLAVRGNIDVGAEQVPDRRVIDLVSDSGTLRILLVHIAVYGPKLRREIGAAARQEGASLVVCGHSHVPFLGVDRGVTVFNPGSVGPRRFDLPIVFGVLESGVSWRLGHVSCETGAPWSPPGP